MEGEDGASTYMLFEKDGHVKVKVINAAAVHNDFDHFCFFSAAAAY